MKPWDLQRQVEKNIDNATPSAALEKATRLHGGFEAELNRMIRDQELGIERERERERARGGATTDFATTGATKAKKQGRRAPPPEPTYVAELSASQELPLEAPPRTSGAGEYQAAAVAATMAAAIEVEGVLGEAEGESVVIHDYALEEDGYEPSLGAPCDDDDDGGGGRGSSGGESSGDDGKALPSNKTNEEKEVIRRRRRRRRQQPPPYIDYAKRREAQLNASEDRAPLGIGAADLGDGLWVVDRPRYTGPDDGRKDDPSPITQGKPIRTTGSHAHKDSPFDKMAEDILQPQRDKDRIGVHYKWEDVVVSNSVVLRTALPTAPPRVPQMVLEDPRAEARTVQDLGSTHGTMVTRPARSLIGDVYASATNEIGSEDAMLPGAAPSQYQGGMMSDGRFGTPSKGSGRGPRREAQREKLQAAQKSGGGKGGRQEAPQLDVALQRRLEVVWDILLVPPMDKLDYVLKYSKVEYSTRLPESLQVWEAIAQCVQRREQLLRELNNLKNSNSALKGSKAVRERMSRLAVALCEHTRDAQQLIKHLRDEFDDKVEYAGSSYEIKIQADLDEELIGMLPPNYEYADLVGPA